MKVVTLLTALSTTACLGVGCVAPVPATPSSSSRPAGEVWLTPQQVKDAHIEVETTSDRPVGGTIRTAGRVTFDDLRVGHVFSPVTGRITRIMAQPGQRVKKGEPLCVIQSPDLGSAVSDMDKAQATLFQTEKDWKRQKDLLEVHAAAQRDYEAAESAYLNAKAEMDRAQRKARLLRQSGLDTVTQEYMLRSPIDGEVIMRGANPGLELQGQYSGGAAAELYTWRARPGVGDSGRLRDGFAPGEEGGRGDCQGAGLPRDHLQRWGWNGFPGLSIRSRAPPRFAAPSQIPRAAAPRDVRDG